MAEKKQPWMKWYPSDWRSESSLRMVSRSARSLWMDMLGLMHEAEPYGELRLNGRPLKTNGLASLLGDRVSDVSRWLLELEVAGVFARTDEGVIFSRRMVRDRANSLKKQENGLKGGNPVLKQKDKQEDNWKDKAQKPEARGQRPDSYARDRWGEVWAAFLAWGKLPETASEHRARETCDRMAAELPPVDELIARIHAQGAKLRACDGKRGGWATAPHNWLERDRGWEVSTPPTPVGQPDVATCRAAWGGEGGRVIDALGENGHGQFVAWFYDAEFEAGPVARITVRKPFVKNQIERKFLGTLRRLYGEVQLEVAA